MSNERNTNYLHLSLMHVVILWYQYEYITRETLKREGLILLQVWGAGGLEGCIEVTKLQVEEQDSVSSPCA